MITSNDKLEIFENFRIDRKLPKHSKNKADQSGSFIQMGDASMGDEMGDVEFSVDIASPPRFSRGVVVRPGRWVIVDSPSARRNPIYWLRRFLGFLAFWNKPKIVEQEIPIEEFFASVKNNTEELVIIEERAQGYAKALTRSQQTGQVALFEQLQAGLNAARMETQLVALGMTRFVREENIVKFYKLSKKGLRLDWIANFTRVIPDQLLEKKIRADEIGIFDNYVVLHYDPSAKAYSDTKAEKAAKKDPILFGVMEGRRLLYYVCDWIDEYCDLTLDQIADTLGKEVIQEIPRSV